MKHVVELSDEEEVKCEAYIRWHAEQPPGGLGRVLPGDYIDTVDEALAAVIAPWRAMLTYWWETHPEVHGESSP